MTDMERANTMFIVHAELCFSDQVFPIALKSGTVITVFLDKAIELQ